MRAIEAVESRWERVWAWLRGAKAERVLRCLVVVGAALLLLLFVYAAVRRMRYPYEVEWIEDGLLVSVLRIVHGQGIYVAPTLDFVPYLYAPVYLYVVAWLMKLAGLAGHAYVAQRLLSTLATLGSCAAIYSLVRSGAPVKTGTRGRTAAMAAAGVYAGCYAVVHGFFDIGRVDSLFVCFLLLALLAQRRGYPVIAALLWVLTFQTKQTVLPLAVLVLCAEWPRPRRLAAALGTFAAVAAASVWLMNHATQGWYSFYIFKVGRGLPLLPRGAAMYWPEHVLAPLGIAWLVIVAAVLVKRPSLKHGAAMFYLFVSVAIYGGVWFVFAHVGASANALMPVYAWTAVMFGVAMARLLEWAAETRTEIATVLVLAAAVAQMGALIYNPGQFIPPATAREASDQFVEKLRAIPGDVYVLDHGYDAVLAGKASHAEGEAMGAVLDAKLGETSAGLQAQLDDALASHRFTAIVIDDPLPAETGWHFEKKYPMEVSTGLEGLRHITSQPQWFLFPCGGNVQVMRGLMGPQTVVHNGCAPSLTPR
jgi:hypothetical protein